MVVLLRLSHGCADPEVEVIGASTPQKIRVISERKLLARGAQIYAVLTGGQEEVYEDLYLALLAAYYATLQGEKPIFIAYDREMNPVFKVSP